MICLLSKPNDHLGIEFGNRARYRQRRVGRQSSQRGWTPCMVALRSRPRNTKIQAKALDMRSEVLDSAHPQFIHRTTTNFFQSVKHARVWARQKRTADV